MLNETVKKITKLQAETLAQDTKPAYKTGAAYLTYTDVATFNNITNGVDFIVDDSINENTGLLEFVDGGYPVRKDKKMFPR